RRGNPPGGTSSTRHKWKRRPRAPFLFAGSARGEKPASSYFFAGASDFIASDFAGSAGAAGAGAAASFSVLPPTFIASGTKAPSLTVYSVIAPFLVSPCSSNSTLAVMPSYEILESSGRYLAGSVEFAFCIAAISVIAASYEYGA